MLYSFLAGLPFLNFGKPDDFARLYKPCFLQERRFKWELIHGFLLLELKNFVDINDKHVQHRDLNSFHKVLTEVDVE